MELGLIFQLLSIAISIFVLVILIVVLARNPLEGTEDENLIKLNNKITWLYALEIAAVGLLIVFAMIGFFMYRRLPVVVC